MQKKFSRLIRKAAFGIGVGIAVGDVGLDVEDGGAVHQVCTAHMKNGAELLRMLHTQELHAGKPQIVGTEGGAGGKDTHAGIAPQPGRAHRG